MLLLHTEVVATVLYEHVHFLETAWIQQQGDTFACCQFAFLVLLGNGLLTTADASLLAEFHQLLDLFCLIAHFEF